MRYLKHCFALLLAFALAAPAAFAQVSLFPGASGASSSSAPWSLATKPAIADGRDEEFEGTLAAWSTSSTVSGSGIDPYTAFNTAATVKVSTNGVRPGWFLMQPSYDGTAITFTKPVTINTNDFVYTRIRWDNPVSGTYSTTIENARIALSLCDVAPACTNYAVIATNSILGSGSNTMPSVAWSVNGTVGALQLSASPPLALIEGLGIHKIGTRYYFWVYIANGSWQPIGTATQAAAMAFVALTAKNSTAPNANYGNPILGFDFVRFKNTATDLP